MKTYISQFAPIKLRHAMRWEGFATLRLNKDNSIRDGRFYETESMMRRYRSSRPESARMFYVVPSEKSGWVTLTEIGGVA